MRLLKNMLAKVLLRPPNSFVFCILAVSANTIMYAECTSRAKEADMKESLFGKENKRQSSQRRKGSV